MKTIVVYYPDCLQLNTGLLEGVSIKTDENIFFYITNDIIVTKSTHTIGYCSERTPDVTSTDKPEWIHINNTNNDFTIHNVDWDEYERDLTLVAFDFKNIIDCDECTFNALNYGEQFDGLRQIIRKYNKGKESKDVRLYWLFWVFVFVIDFLLIFSKKMRSITKHSTTVSHLRDSLSTVRSGLLPVMEDGRKSVSLMNLFTSKFADLILGWMVLYAFIRNEDEIFEFLNVFVEAIIENLRRLLVFLMGSPIGLKLNHAFNTTLGAFFFYHIFLWKMFMHFIKPHLYSIFYVLFIPASLGLSYQAAVLEDLIKVCTIHIYCIYIYAARLYGLQIYAVIALWRLFIGRKYNPLRRRVDSYQYNHNQLFIGVLTFTILLFLLPTTLLYYIVFAVFRLFLKTLNYSLTVLRISLQSLPIYSMVLWLKKSPALAGLIILSRQPNTNEHSIKIAAKMHILPLLDCLQTTLPETTFKLPNIKWKEGLNKLFIGGLV